MSDTHLDDVVKRVDIVGPQPQACNRYLDAERRTAFMERECVNVGVYFDIWMGRGEGVKLNLL